MFPSLTGGMCMKCWSSKSSLLVFFVSMEGGKFERQVASSKAYIQKQKDAFFSESVKLPLGSFRIFIGSPNSMLR